MLEMPIYNSEKAKLRTSKTKIMKHRTLWMAILAICLLTFGSVNAEAMKADQFIQKNIQDIIEIVVNNKDESKKEEKRSKIRTIFIECFDLPRLAGMTLGGTEWKQLSLEEKKLFTEKYAEFVLSFYVSKIEGYNNNKVVVDKATLKSGGKRAVVPTKVEFEGAMANINYSLSLFEKKWRIYDVEVEGVRLSTTYRAQFQSILRKSSFEGLIAEIDKLIAKQLKT